MNDEIAWSLIERYFLDNPQNLVKHHIQSYNDFYKNGIFQIFREKNPLTIYAKHNEKTGEYDNKIDIYFGGKEGNRLYFGKPVIYDSTDNVHYMYPNEARLRNMNYAMSIHYDIEYEVTYNINEGEQPQFFYGGKRIEVSAGGGAGGDGNGGGDDDDDDDYNEHDDVDFNKFGGEDNTEKSVLGTGGGPKRIIPSKKKVKFSSAEASAIREETTKSMVSPSMQKMSGVIEKILLGKFPVMVQSDFCILSGLSRETRFHMGECRNDYGGYFIIDGKEKVIIPQEKFADNMMYIEHTNDEKYLYLANLRSVSENASKPIRTLKVGIVSPTTTYSYKNIVVEVPNVKKPVPLFILFRALGIISDKDIIQTCILDLDKYNFLLDLFMPSVHDGAHIMTQSAAIQYIATLTKQRTISTVMHILSDFFLPHVGELNFREKAYHLGNMVLQLILVYAGVHPPTDRDNFKFKRVDTPGNLLYDLFKEYYNIQQKYISLELEKRIHFGKGIYENDLIGLLQKNYQEIFKERILERGFSKAYKGNWGAFSHTKRLGIVQDLNRLSYNSALNHMRKISLPLDTTSKVVGPRMLNGTQWGIIDPIDTPDGGNIGLHKHMSIMTNISDGISRENMINWLRTRKTQTIFWLSDEPGVERLSQLTKIFVNGLWIGGTETPFDLVSEIRIYRRNGLIPIFISVTFEIKTNSVLIFTDAGRLCRPVIYRDEVTKNMSYENKEIIDRLEMGSGAFTWQQIMCGFARRRTDAPASVLIGYGFYEPEEVYDKNPIEGQRSSPFSIIDFMDTNEEENAYIALSVDELTSKHTHLELHKSLIFGLMCNMIAFPECAPATRNSFSCGQSKQAVSLYSTNFPVRMDKMGVVLNYGQIPLVKTRYLDLVNHEENPYGENVIVAIMCYTGYNVEDAILINEGAINRGCFQTTYFTTYTEHEETANIGGAKADTRFSNIEKKQSIGTSVVGTKPSHDYSVLDEFGLIRQGTVVNDKTIMIGVTTPHGQKAGVYIDKSITTKKGQIGVVDKTFITDNEEGQRIAKVRIMEQRMPGQGDKFACSLPTQQVLTENGWVEMKDIDIHKHKVATLDINGNMCYENPINKFEYDIDNGQLYSVKNKQVEMVCTLNHKMYVKPRYKKKYELIEARDIMGKMVRFKKNMKNIKPDIELFQTEDESYNMDDWLKLLGIEISWKSARKGEQTDNTSLPEYVWNLSERQSIILLNALLERDGKTLPDGKIICYAFNQELANDICRLAVHCGYSGSIAQKNKLYKVSINRKQNEPWINKKKNGRDIEKLIDYTGKVYCIEMPSSNLYYFRENTFAPSMLSGNSRSGQKGTIGLIIPECDMPFTRDGIRPDIILNPHAFPTRQTINQLVETMLGKACLINGGFGDGTAYMNRGLKYSSYGELLSKNGFHSSGNEILYNGMTGEQIESEIFVGPTYYMRLKHMVKDKINYRARGPTTMLTRQPVQGRANDGGLRIGEMEVSAIQGHGMMEMLTNSVMDRSDKSHLAICNKSGMILIYNPDKDLLFSPVVDGPIKFTGSMNDKELRIENISRFGRDFSIIAVPYSFKLLIQELAAINVQIRVITEDNIEHMENMMYNTENLRIMTGLPTPEAVITIAKKRVSEGDAAAVAAAAKIVKEAVPPLPEVTEPIAIPKTKITLPVEEPSPQYTPGTPLFGGPSPETPSYGSETPPYALESPPFAPESPPFAPETPSFSPGSRGGGNEDGEPLSYKEGDTVFMMEDLNQQQPWTITKIGGGPSKFITIFNQKPTNDNDAIRVVSPNEITGVKTIIPPQTQQLQNAFHPYPLYPQQMMGGAHYITPAPVAPAAAPQVNLKVFTGSGSDFSLSTGSPTDQNTTTPITQQTGGQNNNVLDFSQPLLTAISAQKTIGGSETAPVEIKPKSGDIKGGSIVVKKLE